MSRLGPGLLLLPLVTFGAAAIWWGPSHGAAPELVGTLPERRSAWLATVPLEGLSLEVRLAPLQASPVLRSFEARALRDRRGLPGGELWRMELRPTVAEGDASAGSLELDPSAWRVVDDTGVALVPMDEGHSGPASVGQPVDRLLAARPFRLTPGEWSPTFFWGREPATGARWTGLGLTELSGSPAGTGSSVDLHREEVDGADFPRYLARIPRPSTDTEHPSSP